MKKIILTRGIYALIDDEDYPLISQYKWYASRCGRHWYACTGPSKKTNNKMLFMHRLIMNAQIGQQVDHKEHYNDYIDNQRSNLRFCTHSENGRNQQKQRRMTSSQYKGVTWDKRTQKWQSQIQVNKKHIHLGYFNNEIEAARAYNTAAIKYFGEFANLNDV